MIVNTYHTLHTHILSLTDFALVYRPIFTFIWRLDAIVGWHIISRSRVEWQGISKNQKTSSALPNNLIHFVNLSQYLIPWARVREATAAANDAKKSAELWTWLEEQVKDI